MTEEQILQMVKERFKEGSIRDDGSCSEYYGDLDAFVKFAEKMYNQGKYDGYDHGYSSAKFGSKFDEHMGW